METREESQAISELSARLRERFPESSPDVLDKAVADVHHQFDGDPIRDFVPVLVEREVVERLRSQRNPRADVPA